MRVVFGKVVAHTATLDELRKEIRELGEWIKNNGLEAEGTYRAACELLLRRPPRLADGDGALIHSGESTVAAAKRIGVLLDDSVLAIQGPPGAGKTYGGARMICELIRRGKKVGVTAMSHKVIRNLLNEVLRAAEEAGINSMPVRQPSPACFSWRLMLSASLSRPSSTLTSFATIF